VTDRDDVRRAALVCAAAAAAVSAAAALAVISVKGWQPSVLIRMGADEPLAPLARATDPDFAFVDPAGHGDGVYYYAIARDPFATAEEHKLIDGAAYRYGHPGFSWVASAASTGRDDLLPLIFLLLGVAGIAIAAGTSALIAGELGWSPWIGLFVALLPGLIYSVTIDTSEPVGAALLLFALLAWQRGRWKVALPALAFLCFVKEWFVVVPVGLAIWELVRERERHRGKHGGARIVALLIVPLPLLVWHAYLHYVFGEWPAQGAPDVFDFPLIGWLKSMRGDAAMGTGSFDQVNVGHIGLPFLILAGALLLIGSARAMRLRTPFDAAFLAFIPIIAMLNSVTLLYPKDAIRTLAVPMALLPAVVMGLRGPRPHESSLSPRADQFEAASGDEVVPGGRGSGVPTGESEADASSWHAS
jgi:hypothetical protein